MQHTVVFTMDFLGDTSHHDFKAVAPAWPEKVLLPVDEMWAKLLMARLTEQAEEIGLLQERLWGLSLQYRKRRWDGEVDGGVEAQEEELKETSIKLKIWVGHFGWDLGVWRERFGDAVEEEEEGEEEKEEKEEEDEEEEEGMEMDEEGEVKEEKKRKRTSSLPPPPATRQKTSAPTAEPPSLSTIPLPIVWTKYKTVLPTDPNAIHIGDIGWAPLPRMSLSSSGATIPSEYGSISLKIYPFIIVKKLDDCMLGVVISSAGGRGLSYKDASVRQRSTYVTGRWFRGFAAPTYGWALNPQGVNLEVAGVGYEPAMGAFVDVLDTHKICYNTRFERKGCLTQQSRMDLGRMRVSALMAHAIEG
jgi:hypothetical protein